MKRQQALLMLLGVLIVLGLPYVYMDRALTRARGDLAAAYEGLEPLRRQAAEVRRQQDERAVRTRALEGLRTRLIAEQPFATIGAQLAEAGARAGVSLTAIQLEGPQPVPDFPDLVRYQATVQVYGTAPQYLEFLRLLEVHRLLIELPDPALTLQSPRGALPTVQQGLILGFYGSAAKQ